MSGDRRRRALDLAEQALDRPEGEVAAFLDRSCGGDPDLSREVERLLASDRAAAGFLSVPGGPDSATAPEGGPARGAAGPAPGAAIGGYELVSELGRGGMGTVYLARRRDGVLERPLALKLVHGSLLEPSWVRRFHAERRILGRLEHPGIARLVDGGTAADGRPYLVMEWVDGEPIDLHCERAGLGVRETLDLVLEVCDAVAYAHRNLVVHRDLKPSNILVDRTGRPRLLDFGIAKLLDPEEDADLAGLTRTGPGPMSPAFASPEQLRGGRVTTATDVYSLGVLLYRLLTGGHPFDPALDAAAHLEARRRPPARPSQRSPGRRAQLRGDLDNVLLRALAPEPTERYPGAAELAEDLRRHLDGRPVRARPAKPLYLAGRFVRRHRLGVAAGALFAAMVAAFGAGLAREADRTAAALVEAERERDRARWTSDFLLGVFESSDPATARGADVTARELLERGAASLESLAGRPLLEATAADTLGRVLGELAEFERARELLERGLALRRSHLPEGDAEVAESLAHLGPLLAEIGDAAGAEALAREALAIRLDRFSEESLETAESLGSLAKALFDQGRYDEAEPLLRRTLRIRRDRLDADHPLIVTTLNDLANLSWIRGDHGSAEADYRDALEIERRRLGAAHPARASLLNNLALSIAGQGRHAEAEPHFREALALRRELLPDDHPDLAMVLHNLAATLAAQGEIDEAEEALEQALAIRRRRFGNAHPTVGANLTLLGRLRGLRGDLDGAIELYRESLELGRGLIGPDNPVLSGPLLGLGELLLQKGDPAAAEPVLREAHELRRRAFPADNPLVAEAEQALGRCLEALAGAEIGGPPAAGGGENGGGAGV